MHHHDYYLDLAVLHPWMCELILCSYDTVTCQCCTKGLRSSLITLAKFLVVTLWIVSDMLVNQGQPKFSTRGAWQSLSIQTNQFVLLLSIQGRSNIASSDGQLDAGSRIELNSIHKIWIQMNWTQLVSSESDLSWIHWFCWESWVWIELGLVESCNDESELSLNPIYMNPKWIWIHYLPKRIQESTPFHDYNPSFLSQGGAHGNSQLDIMKEAVAGSFCIPSLLYNTNKSLTPYILKSVFQYYHVSEIYGILAVSQAKLHY